jgi:hypothetical protein
VNASHISTARKIARLTALVTLMAGSAGAVSPNLTYNGGPVVSNAQVVMVNWNSSVPAGVQTGMPAFYADILHSDYWGILEEYSTPAQQVRFGAFVESHTITPLHTQTSLTDADINSELTTQIAAGHLPVPVLDAGGAVNTIFMVHFPANIHISAGGGSSCVQFCAYNSTFTYGALKVGTGIVPEQGSTSACNRGCGGSTDFEAATLTSMAVLANVVTNPQAGVNNIAWYDVNYGELGFICQSPVVSVPANGNSFAVYPLWSQRAHACTSTGYLFKDGFE